MEPVADPGALSDQLIPRVDEELEIGDGVRRPKPRETRLPEGHPGDRDRVGRIVLAPAAARPPSEGRQVCRNVDEIDARGEESTGDR
jgi:hypothetical protein